MCRKGYKKLTILCSDTDIAVFSLYHFYDLDANELWMEYGVGQHKRWLPIHEYPKCLGKKYAEHYHFGRRSQVVTQYLRSVFEIRRQHGMLGVSLKKPQEVL